MKHFFLLLILNGGLYSLPAQPSAQAILEKAVRYHDPQDRWPSFRGTLELAEPRPQTPERRSTVHFDRQAGFFRLDRYYGNQPVVTRIVENGNCSYLLDGAAVTGTAALRQHRLDCERNRGFQAFYEFLYGLPMSLNSDDVLERVPLPEITEFEGKPACALRIRLRKAIISDDWRFFFDPDSGRLLGYAYYENEAGTRGARLLLHEEAAFESIRFSRLRSWYDLESGNYLGTDVIVQVSSSSR
jgi:hypothetical protein